MTHKQIRWLRRELLSSIKRRNWKQAHKRMDQQWAILNGIKGNEEAYCAMLRQCYYLDFILSEGRESPC